jgi:hypothetical protein
VASMAPNRLSIHGLDVGSDVPYQEYLPSGALRALFTRTQRGATMTIIALPRTCHDSDRDVALVTFDPVLKMHGFSDLGIRLPIRRPVGRLLADRFAATRKWRVAITRIWLGFVHELRWERFNSRDRRTISPLLGDLHPGVDLVRQASATTSLRKALPSSVGRRRVETNRSRAIRLTQLRREAIAPNR